MFEILGTITSEIMFEILRNQVFETVWTLTTTCVPRGWLPPRASGPTPHASVLLHSAFKHLLVDPHAAMAPSPIQDISLESMVAFRLLVASMQQFADVLINALRLALMVEETKHWTVGGRAGVLVGEEDAVAIDARDQIASDRGTLCSLQQDCT